VAFHVISWCWQVKIRVLLDTGDALVFTDQDPETETLGSYVDGFRTKSPSVSFQRSAHEWTVIPANRIVAISARPDNPDD
jgi:hypothetical protein